MKWPGRLPSSYRPLVRRRHGGELWRDSSLSRRPLLTRRRDVVSGETLGDYFFWRELHSVFPQLIHMLIGLVPPPTHACSSKSLAPIMQVQEISVIQVKNQCPAPCLSTPAGGRWGSEEDFHPYFLLFRRKTFMYHVGGRNGRRH